jgi:hypothetical protein
MDNHHGAGMPYPDGPRWWIAAECPVHGELAATRAGEEGGDGR